MSQIHIQNKAGLYRLMGLLAVLLSLPLWVSGFVLTQLGSQVLALGTVTLSLTFLTGQLGMVSLLQMSLAGVAAYAVAMSGHVAGGLGWGWPLWGSLMLAMTATLLVSVLAGALAARTEGVYTIMLTLAIGTAFANLTRQNYALFNGFDGFSGVRVPNLSGLLSDASNLYALCLAWAVLALTIVQWVKSTTVGMALNGVRDNTRRMQSLGYHVITLRIAGFGVAGLVAAMGGIAMVWYDKIITPGRIEVPSMVDILVMAVMGGFKQPLGPYVGALAYILLKTFAIDVVGPERFNLLIGLVFITVVMCSDDGLTGWVKTARKRRVESGNLERNRK